MANPIPIPMLNILPPSSDNDSWSPAPSPLPRRRRIRDTGSKKHRTRAQEKDEPGDGDKTGSKRGEKMRKRRSHSSVRVEEEGPMEDLASNPTPFLLPPSRCSSLSSRRSRWSLRSLLSKDSDWESCRSVRENSAHLIISTINTVEIQGSAQGREGSNRTPERCEAVAWIMLNELRVTYYDVITDQSEAADGK